MRSVRFVGCRTTLLALVVGLLVAPASPAGADSSGEQLPTSDQVIAGPGWADANNAYAEGGGVATAGIPSNNAPRTTEFGGFGLDAVLPPGATIDTVTGRVIWRCTIGNIHLDAEFFVGGASVATSYHNYPARRR